MELKAKETFDTVVAAVDKGIRKVWLALFAGVTQLLSGLILVTVGGGGLGDITTNQLLVIALSVLGAGGAVYGLTSGSSKAA